MSPPDEKNLFDKDDTLDFIIYDQIEKDSHHRGNRNGGCLTVLVAVLVPAGGWLLYSQWLA